MSSPSATQDSYPYQNEPNWLESEKAIARAAFDAALKRELQEVIQEAKQMANQINEPSDLWDLEHYLTHRRKEIDRKYEYKYSQLTHVFSGVLVQSYAAKGCERESFARGLRDWLERWYQRGRGPP